MAPPVSLNTSKVPLTPQYFLSSTFALFESCPDTSHVRKIGSFPVEFGYTPKCAKSTARKLPCERQPEPLGAKRSIGDGDARNGGSAEAARWPGDARFGPLRCP